MRRLILILLCLAAPGAHAAEGMWTLDNLPAQTLKQQFGFEPDAAWVDKVMKSSVRLANGCSGSFVSPDGLVMTNWHCVARCVQQLSTTEKNYSETGFIAKSYAEEQQCPDIELNRLEQISDASARVDAATQGLSGKAYADAQNAEKSRIESECAGDDRSRRCEVVDLYQGGRYHLYRYHRFQDVRLAFAPETATAFFGGDPDNFNFPRYNLDLGLLRAYENNRPAQVKQYFRVKPAGAKTGELVMVTGHPGSTQRLLTVEQLETQRDVVLLDRLLYLAELRGLLTEYTTLGAEQKLAAQSDLFSVENSYKALLGRLQALLEPALLERKREQQMALKNYVEKHPELDQRVGDAWQDITAAQARYREVATPYNLIEQRRGLFSRYFEFARELVRGGEERAKPNAERLPEFTAAKLPQLEQDLFSEAPIDPQYEKLKLGWSLTKLREQLGTTDPLVKLILGNESPQQLADRLVDGTTLGKVEARRKLWSGGATAVAASEDPMIELARAIDPLARQIRARYENEVQAVEQRAAERIAQARFARYGTSIYPDATFTLRLSFGVVQGWDERGTAIEPYTTIAGLYRHATGSPPFKLAPRWVAAQDRLDGETRLNFVATTDIIGGNSGSPLINRDAEVVGLAFDGNIHSLGGAYWFDERLNRTVAVHPAAMIEALKKVYKADRLASELVGN